LFNIRQRVFRQHGRDPGICSRFAISSDKGFKHITKATTAEWLRHKHRALNHAISELRRIRLQAKARQNISRITGQVRPFIEEQDTHQGLLFQPSERKSA
jgi:hypothetical protein